MRTIQPLDEVTASLYRNNLVINSRYTLQNFIFKNLYEQFSRPLNFYFLLVATLQFISVIAPVNPLSTLLPLLFAFTLTAVKEGYDDVKRHRQDFAYNTKLRTVLDAKQNAWVQRCNADICVGDVLLLVEEEEIPCDVVAIGSTSTLYIRTDNLDGEINLKQKEKVQWLKLAADERTREVHTLCSVPSVTEPPSPSSVAAAVAQLSLECPPPSAMIESFDGRADILQRNSDSTLASPAQQLIHVPLTHRHLLPQSGILKNVAQAVCVAVYTGDDTKCGMNKRDAPVKWAQIDRDVSRYSVYIFFCQIFNALLFGFIGYQTNRTVHETTWYLPLPVNEAGGSALIYPLRFFLLTTVMIPVSFKFVVDVCKYYMATIVEWDVVMQHTEASDTSSHAHTNSCQSARGRIPSSVSCNVKNSSILEDLGQIDYVLSDKTGTLTQNLMVVDSVTICPGYHVSLAKLADTCVAVPKEVVAEDASASSTIRFFAQMVALCNTVEVEHNCRTPKDDSRFDSSAPDIVYHAVSPDEIALCNGMRKLGVSLVFRNERRATLRLHQGDTLASLRRSNAVSLFCDETWLIHHTFHFSSEKRSMGVLVEELETARIWFVVKGADDRVLSMAGSTSHASRTMPSPARAAHAAETPVPPLNAECAAKLALYAHRGLRTLLVGLKEVSRAELAHFLQDIEEANSLTEGRQVRIDALRGQMETGIEILGITAIEDTLQEHVQETISDMLIAGIKVWMLTGDKMETAQQIGLSCGLYHVGDRVICIGEGSGGGHDSSATQDCLRALLEFPLEQLPAVMEVKGRRRRDPRRLSSLSKAAVLACGKQLVDRVLHFDSGNAAHVSNAALLEMVRNEDSVDCSSTTVTGDVNAGGEYGADLGASHRRGNHCTTTHICSAGEAIRPAVLIVQGGVVLETILQDPVAREHFALLASRCRSVICARTTPSQKAAITHFVRHRSFMTLAVGDGGNDVAMLQEAHVGVGIAGKEGQQAARAADFSIRQFSDLRALLFIHGQQAYARTAYVIKYSFYKSMLISFIQLAYNVIGTHASGGTFWNSFSLTMWNGFYTLPQTIFYCFDRFAPRVVLERSPYLYKLTRFAVDIDPVEFFVSFVLRGVLQSVALLWLCTHIYGAGFAYADHGGTASNDVTFSVAYTALMLSQIFTMWWESHSITPLNLLMLLGMPAFYVCSTLIYSDQPTLQYYGVFRRSLDNVGILAAIGIAAALVVPSLIYFTVMTVLHPNPRDTLRQAEVKRQRYLLGGKDCWAAQSLWVRWFHAVQEASSIMCRDAAATFSREGDISNDIV
ncbi:putative phospholipid-translocating P-type ATPase (flippase) [Leptomonas seymouri]|uniref:Putative phospholipid-translocating P-type ATPase (Flippase) n=1 Tax=Leptomonas seymouri TaxID=5684 RepID=A0A0N1PF54_LEPSE|nr:putative phospholipid-translocating P-type ATPase (flippase) [Leptomonas seymouri]|eukprot:KPI90191.1 putative phospholipid-translocating P-type ATPase (flippase) [Leptomonas seymouri]